MTQTMKQSILMLLVNLAIYSALGIKTSPTIVMVILCTVAIVMLIPEKGRKEK